MKDSRINPTAITGRINAKALDLLDENPEGLRWVDLALMIKKYDPSLHPKTVNGCIWKLTDKFSDKVYKP